jgi:hypothetical protein
LIDCPDEFVGAMAIYSHLSDLALVLTDPQGQTKTLAVHKVVLSMHSEFFQALLTGPFRESSEYTVKVEVPDLEAAVRLIAWFYQPIKSTYFPIETFALAEQWLVPGTISQGQKQKKYPGKAGIFVRGDGDWPDGKPRTPSGRILFWRVVFASITPDSFMREFEIHTNTAGEHIGMIRYNGIINSSVEAECKTQVDQWGEYLGEYGFNLGHGSRYYGTFTPRQATPHQQRLLAQLVLRNNTFMPEDTAFIQSLWDHPVAPPPPDDPNEV